MNNALAILNTQAITALTNAANILVPSFTGVPAAQISPITAALAADWGYVNASLTAMVNAFSDSLAGQLYDALLADEDNQDEDKAVLIVAQVYNAMLTAPTGLNVTRANALATKYINLIFASEALSAFVPAGMTAPNAIAFATEYINQFYADVATMAALGVNGTITAAHNGNLLLRMFGGDRYILAGTKFSVAPRADIGAWSAYNEGQIAPLWWFYLDEMAPEFEGQVITLTQNVRVGGKVPLTVTIGGQAIAGEIVYQGWGSAWFVLNRTVDVTGDRAWIVDSLASWDDLDIEASDLRYMIVLQQVRD
jgi:hypothetical protein